MQALVAVPQLGRGSVKARAGGSFPQTFGLDGTPNIKPNRTRTDAAVDIMRSLNLLRVLRSFEVYSVWCCHGAEIREVKELVATPKESHDPRAPPPTPTLSPPTTLYATSFYTGLVKNARLIQHEMSLPSFDCIRATKPLELPAARIPSDDTRRCQGYNGPKTHLPSSQSIQKRQRVLQQVRQSCPPFIARVSRVGTAVSKPVNKATKPRLEHTRQPADNFRKLQRLLEALGFDHEYSNVCRYPCGFPQHGVRSGNAPWRAGRNLDDVVR